MTNSELVRENDTYEDLDPAALDELEKLVRDIAVVICAEQPDIPQPDTLTDLDSFSFVETLLELENQLERKLLEHLDDFRGKTFRDLAAGIARVQAQQDAARGEASGSASGDSPGTPATT